MNEKLFKLFTCGKKIVMLGICSIFVAALILGCSQSEPHLNWIDKWLKEPICQPPCWEHITPGVTTDNEISQILKNSVDVLEVKGAEINNGKLCISWNMIGCQDGATAGVACTRPNWIDNQEIATIKINLACGGASVLLEDIINSYGQPDYLWPEFSEIRGCSAKILYLKQGMVLTAFGKSRGEKMKITKYWKIPEMTLFNAGSDLQTTLDSLYWLGISGISNAKNVSYWKGYGEYLCK
ncbi:MAG: hypothetical protein HPY45_17820 [Anaerolineae bacterium]|nr:hypothetical protein [Anaerolineae bacterium]